MENVLLAGWLLAAFAFFFLSFSFLISSHFISFDFIPYLLSCSFRRSNESVLECGSVGKEIREGMKKGGREGKIKGQAGEYEWLNQLASSVSSLGASVAN